MQFNNKKVTLMGLGIAGGAVEDALFFINKGAQLTITDLKTKAELKSSLNKLKGLKIKYRLGGHDDKDFINADLIIKNPAVPNNSKYLKIAREHGARIETTMGIFSELIDFADIVGITGTKGKSTTASLIYEMIKLKYPNSYLAGNIGYSVLKFADRRGDLGILELSSYQLEDLSSHSLSPHIALITNIAHDHLNRYSSFNDYREAKKLIFKYQKSSDVLILNYDDPYLRRIYKEAASQVFFYSAHGQPALTRTLATSIHLGAYIQKGIIYVGKKKFKINDLHLSRSVHIENILAALSAALVLKISATSAMEAVKKFKGLAGRLQFIGKIGATLVYNDTTATNPYSTLRSIKTFGNKKIALIVGGEDKKLDYKKLAAIFKNMGCVILLPGSASDKMIKEVDKSTYDKIHKVKSLREAVSVASKQQLEIILFSPAAASFNMFANEFDRGEQFNHEVKKLQKTR